MFTDIFKFYILFYQNIWFQIQCYPGWFINKCKCSIKCIKNPLIAIFPCLYHSILFNGFQHMTIFFLDWVIPDFILWPICFRRQCQILPNSKNVKCIWSNFFLLYKKWLEFLGVYIIAYLAIVGGILPVKLIFSSSHILEIFMNSWMFQ